MGISFGLMAPARNGCMRFSAATRLFCHEAFRPRQPMLPRLKTLKSWWKTSAVRPVRSCHRNIESVRLDVLAASFGQFSAVTVLVVQVGSGT